MDKSAPEITFNSDGVCNFCQQAQKSLKENKENSKFLADWVAKIKKDGEGKEYDCLMGLSGGLDSSTTVDWAMENGLRLLTFSFDNNYNTEAANHNIRQLVGFHNLPHVMKTIDQEKYNELQGAFFKAGVKNVEIPTDHILMAITLELAKEKGIKWILSGGNTASESIMPESWGYQPRDLTHIKGIYEWAYGKELTGLPLCSIWLWNDYKWTHGIKTFYPLDFIDYNLAEAKKKLIRKYDWRDYGDKHEESVFTSWFQNFYLFEKFGIDKRKAHYSSLINSGQMTREEALERLGKSPVYPELGIEKKVMSYPKRDHSEFPMEDWYERIAEMVKNKK